MNEEPASPRSASQQSGSQQSGSKSAGRFSNRAILISGLILIAVGIAGTYFATSFADQSQPQSDLRSELPGDNIVLQQVGVMKLISQEDSFTPLRYTATVVARRKSQLSFQASERVDELLVDEGDRVQQGQLLARQDDTAIRALHSAAVARQKQAAAVLAELKSGPRRETIEVARAELDRLMAQRDLTKTTLKRQLRLQQTRAGARQEYDVAASQDKAMRAAVGSAQQRLKELQTGTRQEKINAQQAVFEIAVASVQQTQARLDQTQLKAPFAGRISKRYIDEGSSAQVGSPAFEIVEVDHLEIRFGVALGVARQLEVGQRLPFSTGEEKFLGTVAQIQPTLDRATRTQEIIVNVDSENTQDLVDGQTVRIEFATPAAQPGTWLPTEALQRQVRGLWSVLVLDGGNQNHENKTPATVASPQSYPRVARRDVELLATWGNWSRVEGTLEDSDMVIVSGSSRVSVGQRVAAQTVQMDPPWKNSAVQLSDRRAW